MDENSQKINDLQRQINELRAAGAINRYIGDGEKRVLEDVSDDAFLRIFWDKFYYYNTFFEGIDGFNKVNSIVIDGGGALVTSPGTGTAFADINVDVAAFLGGLSFARESRFRTVVRFTTNSAQDIFMAIGNPTVAGEDSYGFFMDDATLKGFAQTAPGSRTTTVLMTPATGTTYTLDARFYPGNKVEFFVDGIPRGTVSSNLPTTAGTVIWDVHVLESAASAKAVFVGSIEYLQKRL